MFLFNPSQRLALIFKRIVSIRVRIERRVRHEAEDAEAIVEGNHHCIPCGRHMRQRIKSTRAAHERSAVDPHNYRMLLGGGLFFIVWDGDIDEEAIFIVAGFRQAITCNLRTSASETRRIQRAFPCRMWLR